MTEFVVLIPARLDSSRLPGKALADIHGKPMVVRVAEQAAKSKAARVVVATDHPDIQTACQAHGVEVELAHAIITQESVYKLKARSDGVGAMGLMQLMPDTARRWKCYQPYDAECNLNAGNRYLRFLADRYNGNIRTIAAGYNAGEGTADSYLHGTRLKGKNSGIKTPNGVPLASFAYTPKQRARCPSNNWHPTPDCEGQTFDYVRSVLGYYLTYKQHPELIGKTVEPAPSAVAHRQGRI